MYHSSYGVPFQLRRMLGNGEIVDLSFPRVPGVQPYLALKAAVVHAYRNKEGARFKWCYSLLRLMLTEPSLWSVIDHDVSQCTDSGQVRFAEYIVTALNTLACVRLKGYTHKDLQDMAAIC